MSLITLHFFIEVFVKNGYAITLNKVKEQTKAEMTITILKCKCYGLNFLVSF